MLRCSVFLVITVFLASCSLISGATNKVSRREAARNIEGFQLPMKPNPDKALVIVVRTYLKNAVGASPSVYVGFNQSGMLPDKLAELVPMEDFICGQVDSGYNTVFATWESDGPHDEVVSEKFLFEPGETYFIEVETVSFKGSSIEVYETSKAEGLYYVQQAANRLNREHPMVVENAEQARLKERIDKRPKEMFREKVECTWTF